MSDTATTAKIVSELNSVQSDLVGVWERWSRREGEAYAADAAEAAQTALEIADDAPEELGETERELLELTAERAQAIAEGEADLDDSAELIDIIEGAVVPVLRDCEPQVEMFPPAADAMEEVAG